MHKGKEREKGQEHEAQNRQKGPEWRSHHTQAVQQDSAACSLGHRLAASRGGGSPEEVGKNLWNTAYVGWNPCRFRWECPLRWGDWCNSVDHGTLGSPWHLLRQHSCPSHQLSQLWPLSRENTTDSVLIPRGGRAAPQPSSLCKEGQFSINERHNPSPLDLSPISLIAPRAFTLFLIRPLI